MSQLSELSLHCNFDRCVKPCVHVCSQRQILHWKIHCCRYEYIFLDGDLISEVSVDVLVVYYCNREQSQTDFTAMTDSFCLIIKNNEFKQTRDEENENFSDTGNPH